MHREPRVSLVARPDIAMSSNSQPTNRDSRYDIVYHSTLPSRPGVDAYLRAGRITADHETAQHMVHRIVAALAAADARCDPSGAGHFAERLGWALDTERIVFSTPIMTNAGRYPDRPLAACAVPPVDLRGDLSHVKTIVDDYHRAGMGTGFALDDVADPVAVLRYLNDVSVAGAEGGGEDRPVGNMAVLSLSHARAEAWEMGCKGITVYVDGSRQTQPQAL